MSRISKELAGQIATKLTEKSKVAVEELHVEYREFVTTIYEEQTPKEVKDCFKNNQQWFYTRSSICLNGHGFGWDRVASTRPVICNRNSDADIYLTAKIAEQIIKYKRKWEKASEDYKQLKLETETALLNLGTHARIKESFPLAAPMLPPPISNALVCNFDSLTKKLQKQPEIKKVTVK